MRRLAASLFILLMACDFSVFAQRRTGPIYRPPSGTGGSRTTRIPRPIPPPRFDPRTRQPIPTRPPVIRRTPSTSTGRVAGGPSSKVTIPPSSSPQVAVAKTQAKATLDQLRTSLRARLRSSTALSSGNVRSPKKPPTGGGGGGRKPPSGGGNNEEPPDRGNGLKNASQGFKEIFDNRSLRNQSIINIRDTLTRNGFKQTITNNRKGYLFKNELGEEIRIMNRGGGWDIRVRNRYGNNLDEFGNVAPPSKTHNIPVRSQ